MRAISLLVCILLAESAFSRDALSQLNWRRQAVGLRPYAHAPELQNAAETSVAAQARRGGMFHNNHRGVRSGVGATSRRDPTGRWFNTCFAFARISPGTRAAAAVAVSRNGRTYYTLDIAGSRARTTRAPCPRCGRMH